MYLYIFPVSAPIQLKDMDNVDPTAPVIMLLFS